MIKFGENQGNAGITSMLIKKQTGNQSNAIHLLLSLHFKILDKRMNKLLESLLMILGFHMEN